MAGTTYDTGALLAADRSDRRLWAIHAELIEAEIVPTVPAPVLAEAWRGGARQAPLSRLLSSCEVEPMSEEQARAVGVLAGRAGHGDIVDVTVVEGAVRRGDGVVTSDPDDIVRIANAARATLSIQAI